MTTRKTTKKVTKAAASNGGKDSKTKQDLVVFAFRLTAEERDLIHKAAGPAKASRFVRALAVAASNGDTTVVSEIVQAVKASA